MTDDDPLAALRQAAKLGAGNTDEVRAELVKWAQNCIERTRNLSSMKESAPVDRVIQQQCFLLHAYCVKAGAPPQYAVFMAVSELMKQFLAHEVVINQLATGRDAKESLKLAHDTLHDVVCTIANHLKDDCDTLAEGLVQAATEGRMEGEL